MANLPSTVPPPRDATRLETSAKWFGIAGGGFCGLIVLAIVALIIRDYTLRPGDTAGAMGVGLAFVAGIPLACVPAGLLCLVGAALSGLALKGRSTPAARVGLMVPLAGPLAVAACYGAGWFLLQ